MPLNIFKAPFLFHSLPTHIPTFPWLQLPESPFKHFPYSKPKFLATLSLVLIWNTSFPKCCSRN